MAFTESRESSFCDEDLNRNILSALYIQKQSSTFCDVIMKVCGQDIYAHSNVLAAASPYFSTFLSQDLPRQFAQRSPQVIEIQIDGSEPNLLYEEAVSAVIDFIYTGKMHIKESNTVQIAEIARIMQIEGILKFCDDFQLGIDPVTTSQKSSSHVQSDASTCTSTEGFARDASVANMMKSGSSPAFQAKIKSKKLVSVATQVIPHIIPGNSKPVETKEMATSTDLRYFEKIALDAEEERNRPKKRRGRPPKALKERERLEREMKEAQMDNENEEKIMIHVQDGVATLISASLALDAQEGHLEEVENVVSEECVPGENNNIESAEADSAEAEAEVTQDELDTEPESSATQEEVPRHLDDSLVEITGIRRSTRTPKPSKKYSESKNVTEEGVQKRKIKVEKDDNVFDAIIKSVQAAEKDDHEELPNSPNVNVEVVLESGLAIPKEEIQERLQARLITPDDNVVSLENTDPEQHRRLSELLISMNSIKLPEAEESEEEAVNSEDDEEDVEYQGKKRKIKPKLMLRKKRRFLVKKVNDISTGLSPGKFQCDVCLFNTNKVREMSAHMKLHKFESNTCFYCEQKFMDRDTLTAHIGTHKGPNPFYCPICSQRFKSHTVLKMHLPKHSDHKPYICEICSQGFKWKHALKNHMVTHTNKKEHLCDICGYATAHKNQLKAHKLIHTGDTYKCSYPGCNFQATKTQNLKYHILTHTGEKPHQCEVCGQAFSLNKNMKRHMLLHTTDAKHRCSKCTYTSTRLDKMREHLLKQHGFGTPPEKRIRVTDMVMQNAMMTGRQMKSERQDEDDTGDGGDELESPGTSEVHEVFRCSHCDYTCFGFDMLREHLGKEHNIVIQPITEVINATGAQTQSTHTDTTQPIEVMPIMHAGVSDQGTSLPPGTIIQQDAMQILQEDGTTHTFQIIPNDGQTIFITQQQPHIDQQQQPQDGMTVDALQDAGLTEVQVAVSSVETEAVMTGTEGMIIMDEQIGQETEAQEIVAETEEDVVGVVGEDSVEFHEVLVPSSQEEHVTYMNTAE